MSETHWQKDIPHALLEEGQTTSFADDHVGPLHDDNRDEEGRVTSVLKLFTGIVRLKCILHENELFILTIDMIFIPILGRTSLRDR